MREKRSFFQMIFGMARQPPPKQSFMQMLNSSPTFSDFSGNAYDSDTVRATVDAFARNVGKLKPKHIRRVGGKVKEASSEIEWLLQTRPNRFMNAYIFYYRLGTQFLMSNNVFVWIRRDDNGKVEGFYPLVSSNVELLDTSLGMAVRFRFYDGKEYVAPYEDIVHLRRFFFNNDMFGESNRTALTPVLNLITVTNQGIANAIKTSAFIRGILKFTGMIKPDDMKKQTDNFVTDYLSAANNGGIAATDSKAEYVPLESDPKMIDDKQMNAMENKVYSYFGTNGNIVQSNYTEAQWGAFYESMIEPFALQMGLEFTAKIFSDRAQGHGNEILFEANRLQYASNETKVKIIETLVDRGMMSLDQGLEVFNLPPIEGGDKRIMSLNFIDADKANEYQLGKVKDSKETPNPKGGE